MPRQPKYDGNIWRLFTAQALSAFTLWVPIWVVFLQGRAVPLLVLWRVAERRVAVSAGD